MKAVVYVSNSGYTKEYAQMIGKLCDLEVYSLKEASSHLAKGDPIVFLGWVMASGIRGFQKADNVYDVKAVAAVGMTPEGEENTNLIKSKHRIDLLPPFFYLQGGFDIKRLHGFYRWIMLKISKSILAQINKKEDKTKAEEKMIEMLTVGGSCVSEENAHEMIEWIRAHKED